MPAACPQSRKSHTPNRNRSGVLPGARRFPTPHHPGPTRRRSNGSPKHTIQSRSLRRYPELGPHRGRKGQRPGAGAGGMAGRPAQSYAGVPVCGRRPRTLLADGRRKSVPIPRRRRLPDRPPGSGNLPGAALFRPGQRKFRRHRPRPGRPGCSAHRPRRFCRRSEQRQRFRGAVLQVAGNPGAGPGAFRRQPARRRPLSPDYPRQQRPVGPDRQPARRQPLPHTLRRRRAAATGSGSGRPDPGLPPARRPGAGIPSRPRSGARALCRRPPPSGVPNRAAQCPPVHYRRNRRGAGCRRHRLRHRAQPLGRLRRGVCVQLHRRLQCGARTLAAFPRIQLRPRPLQPLVPRGNLAGDGTPRRHRLQLLHQIPPSSTATG